MAEKVLVEIESAAGGYSGAAKALRAVGYGAQCKENTPMSTAAPENTAPSGNEVDARGGSTGDEPSYVSKHASPTAAHVKALFGSATDAPDGERDDALRDLIAAVAKTDEIIIDRYAAEVKAAGLMSKTAFRKAVVAEAKSQRQMAGAARIQTAPKSSHLPAIDVGRQDLAELTAAAWEALLRANKEEPFIFRFGGLPARIERDDDGTAISRRLTEDRMRHVAARVAIWYRVTELGVQPAMPPVAVVRDVLATPDPDLPVLTGIVGAPVFAPDGTLETAPGYHAKARIYYEPASGFTLPNVPEIPSADDLRRAKQLILLELLGEFPFTSDAELAHTAALVLQPFARQMMPSATPLYVIEKPSPGTGASLLVAAVLLPSTGRPVAAMTEGRSEEEWRKRLTAKLIDAPQAVFIDNLHRKLDSSALAAAITAPFWEDRILGQSLIIRAPIRCAWIATGNNPTLSDEMARRSVRIRLDARMDRPWLRDGFRHPDLIAWVKANRSDLVWAALTIIQNWIAQGKPRGGQVLGMFEHWAQVMGGILQSAGIPGFLGNMNEFYDETDTDGALWRRVVMVWWRELGRAPAGVKQLFRLLDKNEVGLDLGTGSPQSRRTRLGHMLNRQRDRRYQVKVSDEEVSLTITLADRKRHGANLWLLVPECGDPCEPCDP